MFHIFIHASRFETLYTFSGIAFLTNWSSNVHRKRKTPRIFGEHIENKTRVLMQTVQLIPLGIPGTFYLFEYADGFISRCLTAPIFITTWECVGMHLDAARGARRNPRRYRRSQSRSDVGQKTTRIISSERRATPAGLKRVKFLTCISKRARDGEAAAAGKILYNRSKPRAVLFDTGRTGEREKERPHYTRRCHFQSGRYQLRCETRANARRPGTFLSGSDLE